jgi:mediator of RNA polymerase II transcription subunit 21
VQVGATVPITKQRNPEKLDLPDVFNGILVRIRVASTSDEFSLAANKKELVADLIFKAKEVEYLIKSMPPPESEEDQVCVLLIT